MRNTDVDEILSRDELLRYGRHLIMPEVGLEGQEKLKKSKVLLIGAGGLGSPAGLYLAAAGLGVLGIVDYDVVEHSNLQRQILHGTNDLGTPKAESAARQIKDTNPHVDVRPYSTRLTSENAPDILSEYDIVVDGSDNFPTRYLVNDACVLLKKPNVYGSIFRFEGQVSVFDATQGPCYRCLYPEPPPPGLVPSCAEGGVFGVLPGIIGTIQATETIKLLLGIGEPLIGRLLLFDALKMQMRELKLRKDPHCPVCGDRPAITRLIDYEEFCGGGSVPGSMVETSFEITVEDLKRRLDRGDDLVLLDVRESFEREIANIGGKWIPLNELPSRLQELNPTKEIVPYCHTGVRSRRAVEFLRKQGFRRVRNLVGGIEMWSEKIDPTVSKY